MRRIVAGIGSATGDDPHLPAVLELARAMGAELFVVHAYRVPDPLLYPYAEMMAFDPRAVEQAREVAERGLADQLDRAGAGPGVHARVAPVPGDLAILDAAADVGADLVVVGATERGPVSQALLGTTASRVMRAAKVPVLILRTRRAGPVRRVLMTTDLSDLSARLHPLGAQIANTLAGGEAMEMRTLLVLDEIPGTPVPERAPSLAEVRRQELEPFLRAVGVPDAETSGRLRLGNPSNEIAAEAREWDADLVVVGTHGRGGISRFLIGSVAEAVAKHAPCDVLVIPAASLTDER